ncbi:MAG: hypothetical protein ACC631_03640, partial [Halocynthiibacter sp.]
MNTLSVNLVASSFLPPRAAMWRKLSGITSTLNFEDYGNFGAALANAHDFDATMLVLFHQDMLGEPGAEMTRYQACLDLLSGALSGHGGVIYVAYSGWGGGDALRALKSRSAAAQAAAMFRDRLYGLCARHPALYVVDLDLSFGQQGFSASFDARNWYASHMRLSMPGLQAL